MVAMLPGLVSSQTVLLLAGTTTFGTQVAAEFVARPESAARVLKALGASRNRSVQ